MKALTLLIPQADHQSMLRQLQHLGCVALETVEQEGFRPVASRAGECRQIIRQLETALDTLDRYVPYKKPLFSPPGEISQQDFWSEAAWVDGIALAQLLQRYQQEANTFAARETVLETARLSLEPWKAYPLPLELSRTRNARLLLGTLPSLCDPAAVAEGLAVAADTATLELISQNKELLYIAVLLHESQEREALDYLRSQGFGFPAWKAFQGTVEENLRAIDAELQQVTKDKAAILQEIQTVAHRREELALTLERAEQRLVREEALERMSEAGSVVLLQGWLPAEKEEAFCRLLSDTDCAWTLRDPQPEEYPDVPVLLKNNLFTRPLNMVTDMYSLPAYGSLDPNPLMAPFFIFFYGFMMADMGYGLLMMAASWFIMKKAKPKGPTMRHMIPLLGWCGISTFIMGALTGGFFGDMLPQLAMMLNPDTSFTAMPQLFSPLDDALAVLIGSLAIGVCQIFTGMGINIYKKCKRGQWMDALCNEGAWFAVFILFAAGLLLGQMTACGIAVGVILVLTQGYGKQGILGKLMGIGGSLYSNITGYFSDILSYSRLMALMLAGAVIAQVFNTLGGITGNVILFFIISMVGNGINFALNLLGCFVHDMRLQCLEFFNRFYEDGGKPFRPLCTDSKHINIVNES